MVLLQVEVRVQGIILVAAGKLLSLHFVLVIDLVNRLG